MEIIKSDTKVSEIIEKYPETLSLFTHYGFNANSKDELLKSIGENSMLKTILNIKQININVFINSLNGIIEDKKLYESLNPLEKDDKKSLNFLGYFPCTIKQKFKEGLDAIIKNHEKDTGIFLNCDVPMGCGSRDEYEFLWDKDNIDEIPDMIISMGFGDFFRKKFVDTFVKKGYFQAVLPENINDQFIKSGLIDPDKNYTIFSLHPYIFLIDKIKLGSLPVPTKWADLLNPAYENNISIGGHGDDISEAFLIQYLKDYGKEAIERLANNIKNIWHGAEMVKYAGTNSEKGAAINVISHFFASTCPKKDITEIIYPEDGIAASHLYMLVKKDSIEKVRPIINYLYSDNIAEYFSEQYFPMINGNVKNPVYEGKLIKWLDWDFIKNSNIYEKRSEASKYFISLWKTKALEKLKN